MAERQFTERLREIGIEVPADRVALLERHARLVAEAPLSLVSRSRRDPAAILREHTLDALTLLADLSDLPEGARLADVGSGGGFPGLVLAAVRPDLSVRLVEARARKAAFLERAVAALGLTGVAVDARRAEEVGRDPELRASFDAVTCRAVGPLAEVAELGLPLLTVGGRLLAPKGPLEGPAGREIEEARERIAALGGTLRAVRPTGLGGRVVVRIDLERRVPDRFPRPPGKVRRRGSRPSR